MDLLRLDDHRFPDARKVSFACDPGRAGCLREPPLHSFEGPEQVPGGGTCSGEGVADRRQFRLQFVKRARRRAQHAQRHAHRCGHADGRRAPDDHLADGARDLAIVGVGVIDHFDRQPPLVEHHHTFVRPPDGLRNVQSISPDLCMTILPQAVSCGVPLRAAAVGAVAAQACDTSRFSGSHLAN